MANDLKFWVKQLQNNKKYAIFKNWLDAHPKMETHGSNVYLTILGGVSLGFWTPFLDLGVQSALFWHLKTGTFAKMYMNKVRVGTKEAAAKENPCQPGCVNLSCMVPVWLNRLWPKYVLSVVCCMGTLARQGKDQKGKIFEEETNFCVY